jgi:hypothetical protein
LRIGGGVLVFAVARQVPEARELRAKSHPSGGEFNFKAQCIKTIRNCPEVSNIAGRIH